MWLKAINRPVRYRWPGGELLFRPGCAVPVPDDRGRKILAKCGDAVQPVQALEIGKVVTIRRMNGKEHLAIVEEAVDVQDRPGLLSGIWYWCSFDGQAGWSHESLVVNPAPRCRHCDGVRFWWKKTVVQCAACFPPRPEEWCNAWRELASVTAGMLPEDPRVDPVLTALAECEAAFVQGSYPAFQQTVVKVKRIMAGESV